MPNVELSNLPIDPPRRPDGLVPQSWPSCAHATCVDVKPNGAGFEFTSTIDGNDGSVTYTRDEVVQFFAEVKGGKWDHLIA
jgi:hypothetical protein